MKIGIIECGLVPDALQPRHGRYPAMFRDRLAPLMPEADFVTLCVVEGEPLGDPAAHDAYLLTGSRHGVYDGLPWIEPLKAFIREAAALRRPQAGICFGHQILAEALGGKVRKADIGWRVGMERYYIRRNGEAATLSMPAFHQDQVVRAPPGTDIIASNEACAFAGLHYRDAPVLSYQFHPEFAADYMGDLITNAAGRVFDRPFAERAAASVTPIPPQNEPIRWMAEFLRNPA